MVSFHQHLFEDREPLKPFVGMKLYFYGVPIRYNYKERTVNETVVSVFCPKHNLEFHHLILELLNRQAEKIRLFQPFTFSGIVVEYKQPKKVKLSPHESISVMSETYGVDYVREVEPYNGKFEPKLSKWCAEQIKKCGIDKKTILDLPNDGSRERAIINFKYNRKKK